MQTLHFYIEAPVRNHGGILSKWDLELSFHTHTNYMEGRWEYLIQRPHTLFSAVPPIGKLVSVIAHTDLPIQTLVRILA